MDAHLLIDGMILYLGLILLLTFHEACHAWVAWKCGDDMVRAEGRVSLNPVMHVDLIGTILLPIVLLIFPATRGVLVGWGRPVPVNLYSFRHARLDDLLVALAGPWMNLLLAILMMALAWVASLLEWKEPADVCIQMSQLSLRLFFFNLLPIPPLDGSHVVRNLVGMSFDAYYAIARYGFIVIVVALQFQFFRETLEGVTQESLISIASWFHISL